MHIYIVWEGVLNPFPNKWKTFKTVTNLPRSASHRKFTSKSNSTMLRETAKNPSATSQTVQASISVLHRKVANHKTSRVMSI